MQSKAINIFLDDFSNNNTYYSQKEEKEIILTIVEDLRYLLNSYSRTCALEIHSLLDYGIPDLTKYVPYSKKDQTKVQHILKNCIAKFDKRLSCIEINQKSDIDQHKDLFEFIIKANVRIAFKEVPIILESKVACASHAIYIEKI